MGRKPTGQGPSVRIRGATCKRIEAACPGAPLLEAVHTLLGEALAARERPADAPVGTGDVWAAIIAELPEHARPLCEGRRRQGMETYGRPLGVGPDYTQHAAEEAADLAAYLAADGAAALARDDEHASVRLLYAAGLALSWARHGVGMEDVGITLAVGRAARRLARGDA
mgnify:CR=1 FL=1